MPRLDGKKVRCHPTARDIVLLLRSALPQFAATIRWWISLDDFVQGGSGSFDGDRQKRGLSRNTRSLAALLSSPRRRRRLDFAQGGSRLEATRLDDRSPRSGS